MIKDSGERTEFSTGAVRDMKDGKGRFDLLPWYGIMEVSKHCEEGAKKYGEHNVDRGIPLHSLMDSASRHLAKFMSGETDEDHLRAAGWNILWALNQRTTHPELNDLYFEKDRPRFEAKEEQKSDIRRLYFDDLKDFVGKDVVVVDADYQCDIDADKLRDRGTYKVFEFSGSEAPEEFWLIPNCHLAKYVDGWLEVKPDFDAFVIYEAIK